MPVQTLNSTEFYVTVLYEASASFLDQGAHLGPLRLSMVADSASFFLLEMGKMCLSAKI